MRQRRKITNLVLACAAVLIGVYAQSRIRRPDLLYQSLALYVLAAAIFVIALRRDVQQTEQATDHSSLRALSPMRRRILIALAAVSLFCCLVGLGLFYRDRPPGIAWFFYLSSVAGFLVTVWMAEAELCLPKRQEVLSRLLHPSREHILVALLILAAFILRFYRIEQQPLGLWYDEADNGLWARLINQDSRFRPIYVDSTNLPSHFLFLIAWSFRLFGESVAAIRLVTALFGTLTVWITYLLVRDALSMPMGLVAAFVMAVSHWNVNFSRLGMHGVTTPFFMLLVLYFIQRGIRSRRYVDFALAGAALGLGLCFYAPYRLYPFVIAFLFLHLMIAKRDFLKQHYIHLIIFLVAALVAVAPVGLFALQRPQVFFARTYTTSIFKDKTPEQAIKAVRENAIKHLLMFNYRGDGNGRHNLPGEPMLDFMTSVFFVLGLGYSLYRFRDPRYSFLAVGFFVMLAGGVFSLDFEAPQSLRAIGTLPISHLLAFAAIGRLWQEFDFSFGARRAKYAWIAVLPMLAYIGYTNIEIYFVKQARDFACWNAHSTPETIMARRMVAMGNGYDYRVISLYYQTPSVRFLAPNIGPYKRLETTDSMPLYDTGDQDIVLFIDADRRTLYEDVRRFYPDGKYEEIRPPFDGPVVLYICHLTSAQVRGIQGLVAAYYDNEKWEGEPILRRKDAQVSFDWSQGTPLPMPFSVEWQGTLRVPRYGYYHLGVRAPAAVELLLDETSILTTTGEAQLPIAEGNHALRLRAVGGKGVLDLYWQPPGESPQIIPTEALYTNPPVTNNGLLGRYYPNAEWRGEPALAKIDPSLGLYFHITLLPRPYTVEWVGKINVPVAGNYGFGLESIDDSWLYIDDRLVVETHVGNQYRQGQITLSAGLHDIRVRYIDKSNWSHINLYWIPPGEPRAIIPAEYLFPPQGSYAQLVQAARPTPTAMEHKSLQLLPVASWGGPGNGAGQFQEPRDIAIDAKGRIYVADTGNRRIQVFDSDGNFVSQWDKGDQAFIEPLAVVVNSKGEILVLDSEPCWIYRFSSDGSYLGKFGGPEAQLYHPRGMAIDDQDKIYVADTGGGRFVLFDANGAKAGTYGSMGTAPGQFLEPTDVAVDAWGDLYAVDTSNHRIQRLDVFGRYQGEWAIPLANAYNGPHIELAGDGSFFVTAPEINLVQRYASDGTLLGQWGEGILHIPVNLALKNGRLYVTDTLNHRIQVFQVQEEPQG